MTGVQTCALPIWKESKGFNQKNCKENKSYMEIREQKSCKNCKAKENRKTIYAWFIGYVVQAVVNNFVPVLFLTFEKTYGIPLSKITIDVYKRQPGNWIPMVMSSVPADFS